MCQILIVTQMVRVNVMVMMVSDVCASMASEEMEQSANVCTREFIFLELNLTETFSSCGF